MAIKPIFLFSISRSGSTLVQRIIAAHDGVATVSEPWVLLPYAYSFIPHGVTAEYPHAAMVEAIEDFCQELPGGVDDYRQELHDMTLRLFRKAAGEEPTHFLDKSPYYFVADKIIDLFPEGKYIFLWRNPLSIAASSMSAWGKKWKPTLFRQELFVGLPRLIASYERHADRSHSVRYEDLVTGDEAPWRALMEYLNIKFDPMALSCFSEVKLKGRMGDPTGVKQYASLSIEPLGKWKRAFANPLRKDWCYRYLRFISARGLSTIGYEAAQLRRELEEVPSGTEELLGDTGRLLVDIAKEPLRARTRNKWIGGPSVIRALIDSR